MREERHDDLARQAAKDQRIADCVAADERTDAQVTQEILSSLGLDR